MRLLLLINAGLFRRVSKICEKRLLVSSCLPARQLRSHWTAFHEV